MADDTVGEVFVVVRPDLRQFEAELQTALRKAVRGIVPPTAGLSKGAAAQTALGTATKRTTRALSEQAIVMQANSTELARFSRGVAATSLAQFGLRGATLASTSSFLAGAAAITALAKAVGLATSFNSQLAVFGATTGATASQLELVSAEAKRLGASLEFPGVTATDAAVAMTELAKAGLSVQDAIAGAAGVLQLAGAANIDFAESTQIVASAINAFQLAGRDASTVADVLANAANSAQGSIVDVGVAFQQAAAIGHQVGLSFQDTTLFITQLAKAGLTSSDAGTSLRTALIRLINPTEKVQKVFKQLGIQVRDAQGNLRPDFFTNLGDAIAGMSAKQRDATLAIIGGQDAVRALSILSRTSIKDLLAQRAALDKVGTAAEVNKARMTGLKGAGASLSNTIETLALNLGQKATPALIDATNGLTAFITTASESNTIALLGETLHAVATAAGDVGQAIQFTLPIIGSFITLASSVGSAVGPQTILAAAGAYIALNRATKVSTLGLRLFLAEVSTSIALGGSFRATAGVMASSLVTFARSLATSTVGVSLLAAGLIFLITREDEGTKATNALKDATNGLLDAFRNTAQSASQLADAQSALRTDKIAQQSAKLQLRTAQNALANTKAAHSSLEYQQALNAVAIAQDNVRRATAQTAADQEKVNDLRKDSTALTTEQIAKANEEGEALRRVANVARQIAEFRGGSAAQKAAQEEGLIVEGINERLAALAKVPGAESRALAARLNAIKRLVGQGQNFDLSAQLVLRAPNLDEGLRRVASNFRNTGNESGAAFVEGLRQELNPQAVARNLTTGYLGAFRVLGEKSGASFGQSFVNFVQTVISRTNTLIVAGATQLTTRLSNQTDTLLQNVQRTELTGGSLSAQLAIAKEARARAQRELAAADAVVKGTQGKRKSAVEAQKKALQDLANADSAVDRIQREIASRAKDAADERRQKAEDLQKARDDADQAFIESLSSRQAILDLALAKADLTKSLQDNIDIQLAITASLRQEIAQVDKSIQNAKLAAATKLQLQQALAQSQLATKQLIEQQKEAAKQRIIDKRDRQEEGLELDIQIAEAQKNKAKELKAHQALLKFLQDRIKHTDAGTIARKQLLLKIEQEKAAIKELRKANKDRSDALRSLEFEFLQTQAGFAANLLGNLLPTSAVAGTVGGGGVVTPAGAPPAGTARIDSAINTETQRQSAPGPSHGQIATLIAISRLQLQVLQRWTKTGAGSKLGHPEASVQRAAQHAAMDTIPF